MEYEILEAAFARAGAELDEAKKKTTALEQQAVTDASEREALRARVRALESLAAARQADAEEQAARDHHFKATLAAREASLACVRDDLRLERDIVEAVRLQVDAAEQEREASLKRISVLRSRLEETGQPLPGEEPASMPTDGFRHSWEALLNEQVEALQRGLASRDEELMTLKTQLEASRSENRRLAEGGAPLARAQEQAAYDAARLRAELSATRAELEARALEADAATAAAELARARLVEQQQWMSRRDAQLDSARRENEALRDELSAAQDIARDVRAAAGGMDEGDEDTADEDDDDDGTGVGGRAGGARGGGGGRRAPGSLSADEWQAKVSALQSKVSALESQLEVSLASSSLRLVQEASEAQRVHGELQSCQQALRQSRTEASEAHSARRVAESRLAELDGERRVKSLEVSRLSAELGAMRARLQASAQEVRSTDEQAAALRERHAIGEREVARLRDGATLGHDLNEQLKQALARESARVAKAWEQREGLRAALQSRDDELVKAKAELDAAREASAAAQEELESMREQRRLSEILLRGAEERSSTRQHAISSAKEESTRLAAEVSELTARLESLRSVELRSKEEALIDQGLALERAHLSSDAREQRVALLSTELDGRNREVLSLRTELGRREAELESLREGALRSLEERLHAAASESAVHAMQRDEALDTVERLKRTLERRTQEVVARGEQLRISHESALLLTLEATLKDERLQSVSESLQVERVRNEREAGLLRMVREEADSANASVLDLTRQLTSERERGNVLEVKLAQREEQGFLLLEELRAAELRGDGKEQRLALLRTKAHVASGERELFDTRLNELHIRLARFEADLAKAREEKMLLLGEATQAQATSEAHRSEAHGLRLALQEAETRLGARDEQMAILQSRLSSARDDLNVQLAMVQEEMRGASLRLEAKDVSLDLQMEEALSREKQAHGFIAEVGGRLKRAKEAMAAKDDLLHSLGVKLQAAVASLRSHEDEATELRSTADADRRNREVMAFKLGALEERHMLVQADYVAASEALDGYRDSLVQAEVKARQDRERMDKLTSELQTLQAEMTSGAPDGRSRARPAGSKGAGGAAGDVPRPTGGIAASLPLPPLASAVAGADIASSRVHFLYFLSSFLLLKTALSRTGEMANVHAQDVYDEIIRNEVPLDEWPTYIFTRVFAQRTVQSSRLYDTEIEALKAAAKRQDAVQQAAQQAASGDAGRSPGRASAQAPSGKTGNAMPGGGPVVEMPVVEG